MTHRYPSLAIVGLIAFSLSQTTHLRAQEPVGFTSATYEYETKPSGPEFEKFFPRKAPVIGDFRLEHGDRLAICGDSITEQKMYSRIIETYLTVCVPELEITTRQYGWSGEKTNGFLQRMEQDCLTFHPTIATMCYGMNDTRYRPFDVNNGRWFEDHTRAIVRKFKKAGVRVVLGSPGASGKLASWVQSRSGTLDEHNLHLCALRDIAIGVAETEKVAFADIFWPMYQAQVFAPQRYSTPKRQYEVAGEDGIHPGWAGHAIMAYSFLRSFGLDGDLGSITIDYNHQTAVANKHTVVDFTEGILSLESRRYPFCATGALDDDESLRSGLNLVPFYQDLNRLELQVTGLTSAAASVHWGKWEKRFSTTDLAQGINLTQEFPENPFSAAFAAVDQAVAAKQAYETKQIKQIFHRPGGHDNFADVVQRTEAVRTPLADAIRERFTTVKHQIRVEPVQD